MARPHFRTPIEELEALFKANLHNLQILGEIREELTYRTSERAKQLIREIRGIEEGLMPKGPTPQRPERPEDQGELL